MIFEPSKGSNIFAAIRECKSKINSAPDEVTKATMLFNDVALDIYHNSREEDIAVIYDLKRQLGMFATN